MGAFVAYKRYAHFDLETREDESGLIYNKFYIDELYDKVFVKNMQRISTFFGDTIDANILDKYLMKSAKGFMNIGEHLRFLQNGNVRYYAFYMLLGISAISTYLIIKGQQ